jgi:hypothetical protein
MEEDRSIQVEKDKDTEPEFPHIMSTGVSRLSELCIPFGFIWIYMDSGANARHLIGKALYRQSPMYQMHILRLHNPETIERLCYLGLYPRSDSRRVP